MSIDTITIVLSSSLLAAIFTLAGNYFLQRNNYRDDYYKKILSKRIEAYVTVENLIGQLNQSSHREDGKIVPMICALGKEHFDHFMLQLMATSMQSIWLSAQTKTKTTELNIFLMNEIEYKISSLADADAQVEELGAQQREAIKNFRLELQTLLFKDIQSLHKIESFLKSISKKEKSTLLILNKPPRTIA